MGETDLISRQEAIDAFDCTNELIVGGAANAQNVVNYINKVVGKIKDLPSAQPEIIRCKDCVYYDPSDNDEESDWCHVWGDTTEGNAFCSYAERKGEQP